MGRGTVGWAVGGAVAAVVAVALAILLLDVGGSGRSTGTDGDTEAGGRARNVILVVGDGMGAAQREAARLALAGFDGRLEMDRLPVLGMQTTDPADPDDPVTDSAAAATAWATGERTVNGAVSTDVDGQPLTPLGTEAGEAGKATGVVTTSLVTDATPAAFFASVRDRGRQAAIAGQYVEQGAPDVILGGGEGRWLPRGDEGGDPGTGGSGGDSDGLVGAARDAGYDVVTGDDLSDVQGPQVLGLFADEEMWEPADEGEGDVFDPPVSLADMTRTALDVLSEDPDGFFLLVEEEAVDGFGHANNGTRMLEAMESLDSAVAVARAFAEEHPDTLLIVTGDHEAGGLSIEDWDGDESEDGPFAVADSERRFALDWTTGSHTGVPTPVTATGPGSGALAGQYPNTYLHEVMRAALVG